MPDFLFEIGLEEIPGRMIAAGVEDLQRRITGLLERERLVEAPARSRSFGTPRRLAVLVRDVATRQQDLAEEVLGPSVKVAFQNGQPTPAAMAFARKSGVAVEALRTVATPKGKYCAATAVRPGRTAIDVLGEGVAQELSQMSWPKSMYWREGKPERFVRPVRWMAALLGDRPVPISFGGVESNGVTYGHRVLAGDAPISILSPETYEQQLLGGFVVADIPDRRQRIRKALDRVCRTVEGARWREDTDLVEIVTQLTEWPSVVLGSFPPEFLDLPEEVLVTVMRDHQRYFAVEDAEGRLLPHFLAVLNTATDAASEAVIRHGNERVLRARFSDAQFFWSFDQRLPLLQREPLLEQVTFQRDLGSYAAKSERVRGVARRLAEIVSNRGAAVDADALDLAARLSKTDLTTDLVKEFTELQGIVGGLYARAQDLGETVAVAIYDQYRPVSMEDAVPRSVEGALLAIADKTDTVAGMFGLGTEPTGSKDPFALRRAANGVVKILAEGTLPLTLGEIAGAAEGVSPQLAARVLAFFRERLEFYLRDMRGHAYDVVAAVLASGADRVRDAVARAEAVAAVRSAQDGADFLAVSAAFKRMRNILEQAGEKGIAIPDAVDETLLLEPEEVGLAERSADVATEVRGMQARGDYQAALQQIATLRPEVDAFFGAVMVMVPEQQLRANRLALLARVLADLSRIADFSLIVRPGS